MRQWKKSLNNIKGTLFIKNWLIDLVGRVFANVPEDLGSIPGHIIPKTLKNGT